MLNPQESNDYAIEFVKNCKKSSPDYDSTQQPFIMGNPVEHGMIDTKIDEVNKIFEKIPLHHSLKKIYQVIKSYILLIWSNLFRNRKTQYCIM